MREQIAGDELATGDPDAIIATMYLRLWIYEHNQRDVERQWREILDDITETTSDVFLGLGLRCARCHDHKFDPILQADYYGMKAFFAGLLPAEDLPIGTIAQRAEYNRQLRKWADATDEVRRAIRSIELNVLLQHSTREGFDKFVPKIKEMITKWPADRTPYEHQIALLAERQYDTHPDKLPEWLDAETEARRQELYQRLQSFNALKPAQLPTVRFVATDVGTVAPPVYLGDSLDGKLVEPGFPHVLGGGEPDCQCETTPLKTTTGRRTALANWIVSPDNRLTARVMVNRVWQQLFGQGLVTTSSDFGRLGDRPSHPELLDWLAHRFVADRWSVKRLHRLILTSATWQQTSHRVPTDEIVAIDQANRLIWKMNARRLSAEEIADTVAFASGSLAKTSRAIYRPVKRNSPDRVLAQFDFPDRIRSQGRRHRTTTPAQALLLMNHPWLRQEAHAMANRFAIQTDQEFIKQSYLHLFGRAPRDEELTEGEEFFRIYRGTNQTEEGEPDSARTALAHILMNSNELIYVD